jgi:hypothetical protein
MSPYQWDVRYDHNGFRNPVDLTNAGIVVVGDSFVEGMTVASTKITTAVLQRLRGGVVANLGQPGYGPQQELVVLKRYGLPLHPAAIVWMFFEGNDLGDVEHYDDTLREQPKFWPAFFERSFTKNALRRIPATRPLGVKVSGVLETPVGPKETIYFAGSSADSTLPLGGRREIALKEVRDVVKTTYTLATAHGARLIFVFIPDKFRALHAFCQFPAESECRNWTVNDLPERLHKAIGSISSDIGYLDLTPKLMEAVRAGVVPYYSDDEHWTADGHRIAAEAISGYLGPTGVGESSRAAAAARGLQ